MLSTVHQEVFRCASRSRSRFVGEENLQTPRVERAESQAESEACFQFADFDQVFSSQIDKLSK